MSGKRRGSGIESDRETELRLLEMGGRIHDLVCQERINCEVFNTETVRALLDCLDEVVQAGSSVRLDAAKAAVRLSLAHVFAYYADFTYFDKDSGRRKVEDVKGQAKKGWDPREREYVLKKKLLAAAMGVHIEEEVRAAVRRRRRRP
jgi:hypothetical protein